MTLLGQIPYGDYLKHRARKRMKERSTAVRRLQIVDLVFDNTGIRLIGLDDTNRIEVALIRGLNYADEDNRTVASTIGGECSNGGSCNYADFR